MKNVLFFEKKAEVLLSQGSTIGEAARKIGVTDEIVAGGEENTVA